MKFSWAVNLHDADGDVYNKGVLAFCGDSTILRFKTPEEMEDFANEMLRCLPEMREVYEI
jgi:hypothetical protein